MVSEGAFPEISGSQAARIGRRAALRLGVAALVTAAAGPAFAGIARRPVRALALRNLHTHETVRATYWADGSWQADGLREINYVLRDFRTGDVVDIDAGLLDLMHRLAALVGTDQPFEIISGYRSPRTNAQLANQSSGVAKKSLHMEGKAVDLRLPGVKLSSLRRAAISLQGGGVGYYPKSGFIHVDTGRVRFW
ncbi:MAG: DUF882 domain-containing protein [Alphaproteobacteria bacterium]|nr:DUF882 domain-containing protein [Alphaproteobacteria bacterium]